MIIGVPLEGRVLEVAVLGSAAEFTNALPYFDFKGSLLACLKNQSLGWNPFNPSTYLGRQLRFWVAKDLSLRRKYCLGLYSALGSALDRYHGVDGFFYSSFDAESPIPLRRRYVTFDLATYQKPAWEVNADLLITGSELLDKESLRSVGRTIARFLKGRLDEFRLRSGRVPY
jgi:hypothetical protein